MFIIKFCRSLYTICYLKSRIIYIAFSILLFKLSLIQQRFFHNTFKITSTAILFFVNTLLLIKHYNTTIIIYSLYIVNFNQIESFLACNRLSSSFSIADFYNSYNTQQCLISSLFNIYIFFGISLYFSIETYQKKMIFIFRAL